MTRRTWTVAGAIAVVAGVGTGGVAVMSSASGESAAADDAPVSTVRVERGELSALVSVDGILAHRARPDGSPYTVVNQASGTYTKLPEAGDKVGCGDVLYRVDDEPVLLLCGAVPAYRDLQLGDEGKDVRELNSNLHKRDRAVDPADADFSWKTQRALEKLQRDVGVEATGELAREDAVFLPEPMRIAKVSGEFGGSARAGTPVAQATFDTLEVRVDLDASQQGQVKKGARARITLPGNATATGRVDRIGRAAQVADDKDANPGVATVPAYVTFDDPGDARRLDSAPVDVDITTAGVKNALSVPVTALVGKSGGGFGVEVVRAGGQRELVAVGLGLSDTTAGRVEVEGDVREGDQVVVPGR